MRRFFLFSFMALVSYTANAQDTTKSNTKKLLETYTSQWKDLPEYKQANTALYIQYLSHTEKMVFFYLNLARMNPPLFARTFVEGFHKVEGYKNHPQFEQYKKTLIKEMSQMAPIPPLQPEAALYNAAFCHAVGIGRKGMETHDRDASSCPKGNFAENIAFGNMTGLEIVLGLLVDAGEAGVGHRVNCLNKAYNKMGVSIQPHNSIYKECTVMDMY